MGEVEFIEDRRRVMVRCCEPGQTLLDVSLAAGIPHYHACDGQGRCSTCRVLVTEGIESLGPRTPAEAELARQRQWPENVRLACQVRPAGSAKVRRVVNDEVDVDLGCWECCGGWPAAEEKELGLLFCDIRGFTEIAEQHLAYDVVHALNRFFKQLGDPVIANGGTINKYMGDGFLALFGIEGGSREERCLRTARAGVGMLAAAKGLNLYLEDHFNFSFEPRIGLHYGRVLVGQLGHPSRVDLTVIGDAVNAASRIESSNKAHGTDMLASEELVGPIRGKIRTGRVFEGRLRGRRQRVLLHEIVGLMDEGASP